MPQTRILCRRYIALLFVFINTKRIGQAQREKERLAAQQERDRQEQLAKEAAEKARATMPEASRHHLKLTATLPFFSFVVRAFRTTPYLGITQLTT